MKKRFEKKYASFCIVIVNFIILILLLSLISQIFIIIYREHISDEIEEKYDKIFDQDIHGDIYEILVQKAVTVDSIAYKPYTGFRRTETYKEYVNVNSEGLRFTSNPCSNSENITKIFVFGGSTVWGVGSADNYTIPSYISKKLCHNNINVEVTNYGESSYVSTQEMINLIQEVKKGERPDIVIFYDGHNDFQSTYRNKETGLPTNMEKRKWEFNSQMRTNFIHSISLTPLIKILNEIINRFDFIETEKEKMSHQEMLQLGEETRETYVQNMKIVENMKEDYDFETYYIWQPIQLYKSNKTKFESEINNHEKFYNISQYENTSSMSKQLDNFYNFIDIFEEDGTVIFLDNVHTTKYGNEIVSEKVVEILMNNSIKLQDATIK